MEEMIKTLEYDEESDYILDVIESYEKQGLNTNVDFNLAELEKGFIISKQSLQKSKFENEENVYDLKLSKEEIKMINEIYNEQDIFEIVM